MRKLIWLGTALVLFMAGGTYFAASYAARNPESFLGQCARFVVGATQSRPAVCCATAPATGDAPACAVLDAVPTAVAEVKNFQILDAVIEPIVVAPAEAPSALPALPPEIAAAIERLWQDEESEPPRQAFDAQTVRMPYADEVEVLHMPTRCDVCCCVTSGCKALSCETVCGIHVPCGMFFLPPSCWSAICDQVMAGFRKVTQSGEE